LIERLPNEFEHVREKLTVFKNELEGTAYSERSNNRFSDFQNYSKDSMPTLTRAEPQMGIFQTNLGEPSQNAEMHHQERRLWQHAPAAPGAIPRESFSDAPFPQLQSSAHQPTTPGPSGSANDTTILSSTDENYLEAHTFTFLPYRAGDQQEANNTTHDNRGAEVLLSEEHFMQDIFSFVDMDGGSDSVFGFGQFF
jgi:hypothetical protein